jgi:hypothetical protein
MTDDTALIAKPCVETARAKHSTLSKPRNYSGVVHERHNCRHLPAHRRRGVNLGEGTAMEKPERTVGAIARISYVLDLHFV